MKLNKKLIILSIVGLVLIGIIGGASFAYFSISNQQGEENTVKSGTMALLFTDGQQVTASNLAPGEYIEKTFKVKNTGNVDTRYDVYFSEVVNTFVDQTDLVYTLTSSDGGYNTTSEVQVPNTESKIVNQQLISPNEEHTYTLRITFKLKQTIQNVNMGRTFTAKININEFNSNSSEHLLKLIDVSGSIVDQQILAPNQSEYALALSNTDLTSSTNIYCNNGGIPTINSNMLNVTGITADTVCTISNDIMDTMENKLTTSKTGIVMTNSQNDITVMELPASKEVVLDLNGKEINGVSKETTSTTWNYEHCGMALNNDNVTVNDSIGTGGIYTGGDGRVFHLRNNNNLIVNNGTYSGRQAIVTEGGNNDVVFNDGNYYSLVGVVLSNEYNNTNNMTVNGGTYINKSTVNTVGIYNSYANMIINGGTFSSLNGTALVNGNNGTMNINGGDFTNRNNSLNNTKGTVNISDGYFESTESNTIFNNINGTLNITGGNFVNSTEDASLIVNGQADSTGGISNISGGTFTSNAAVINNFYELGITGGTFRSVNSNAIHISSGTASISDADVHGTRLSINNPGSGTITINSGKYVGNNGSVSNSSNGIINIKGGEIESTVGYALYNGTNGTVNINGNQATFDNNNYISGVYIHSSASSQLMYNNGTLIIENGTFKDFSTGTGCDIMNSNGKVVINNGDFYSYKDINVYGAGASSDVTINNGTFYSELHTNVYHDNGLMYLNGGVYTTNNKKAINSRQGTLYVTGGIYNGDFTTNTYSGLKGSQNYICGGTFTHTGNNIVANEPESSIKYKSSVVWTGKSSPTIGGSYASTVSLDDTITCPTHS